MSYQSLPQVQGIDYVTFEQVRDRRRSILDLQIGDRCNLKCIYCFTSAGNEVRGLANQYHRVTGRKANLLTADEQKEILDASKKRSIKNLIISSEGENTLYEAQLFEIISHARDSDFSVAMFTNGTRIDDKLAKRLKANKVSLMGKLNSLNPTANSFISKCERNGYSYAELNGQLVPDYIHRLKNAGYSPSDFALNIVVNSINQDELTSIWDWARNASTGVTPFGEFLEPTGFVQENRGLEISPEKMNALKREIRKLDASLGHEYDELPDNARLLDMRHLINPHVVVVDSRGFVKDLAANFDLDSVLGNVRDIDLEVVLGS